MIGVISEVRSRHHNCSACRQHSKHVVHRKVKTQSGNREDAVFPTDSKSLIDVQNRVQRAAMVDHHAFRKSCGPRGVNHVGEIFRFLPAPVCGRIDVRRLHLIDLENFDVRGHAQAISHGALRQRDLHVRVLQQVALAFRRQFRIDGKICRARKMNPQDRNDLLPALLHHDGD